MVTAPPRLRRDLTVSRQEAAGGFSLVVKDPASGRYYRFRDAAGYVAEHLDGETTLEAVRRGGAGRGGGAGGGAAGRRRTVRRRAAGGDAPDLPQGPGRHRAPGERRAGRLEAAPPGTDSREPAVSPPRPVRPRPVIHPAGAPAPG